VQTFFGHPLMAYGISAALNSGLFQTVVVSSEDHEIERVARWYGAEFVQRPAELATDSAKSIDAITHAMRELTGRGVRPEFLCQILPNCPLVRSADLLEHWERFRAGARSFQISVVAYRCVYPEWAMTADEEGRGRWLFARENLVRSQDLSSSVCPTGAVWWARCADLLAQNTFYGSPFHLEQIDANRGVDIDDADDMRLAELLVHGLTVRDGISPLEPARRESYAQRGTTCLRE
jgi:CMP-N-acetylneuraminic acid synthetase